MARPERGARREVGTDGDRLDRDDLGVGDDVAVAEAVERETGHEARGLVAGEHERVAGLGRPQRPAVQGPARLHHLGVLQGHDVAAPAADRHLEMTADVLADVDPRHPPAVDRDVGECGGSPLDPRIGLAIQGRTTSGRTAPAPPAPTHRRRRRGAPARVGERQVDRTAVVEVGREDLAGGGLPVGSGGDDLARAVLEVDLELGQQGERVAVAAPVLAAGPSEAAAEPPVGDLGGDRVAPGRDQAGDVVGLGQEPAPVRGPPRGANTSGATARPLSVISYTPWQVA